MTTLYYQNDSRWNNEVLGYGGSETIGYFGCLLVSLVNIANHFGGSETPTTLNGRMRQVNGFQGPWVKAYRLTALYPHIVMQKHIECHNQPAPLALINTALAGGSLPIVRVDYSPDPGIQSHWVILREKQGDDYTIWDPHNSPHKASTLLTRFGHGGSAAQVIQEIIFMGVGSLPTVVLVDEANDTTQALTPDELLDDDTAVDSIIVRPTVNGLTMRRNPSISGSNVIKYLSITDRLRVLHAPQTLKDRLGKKGEWIKVKDIEGRSGYVAAWYITVVDDQGFGVQGGSPPTPSAPKKLIVKTSAQGLSLRTAPRVADDTFIAYLPFGTQLQVIDAGDAEAKIGQYGEWLEVQTLNGRAGYVAAWYVQKKA